MAKINSKQELKRFATNLVAKVLADVNAQDIERGMQERGDYTETRKAAQQAAEQITHNADLSTVPEKWVGDFAILVVDAVLNEWNSKVKALRNARNRFQTACHGITMNQAMTRLKGIVEDMGVRGVHRLDTYGGQLTLEVRRGRNIDATLYVRVECEYDKYVTNPDNSKQRAGTYTIETQVSWSSTQRNAQTALLNAKLYQELAEIGMELEVRMADDERVVWTQGVESK